QTVTVTATSQVDTSKSASATITLMPPVTVTMTPAQANLYGGQTRQFNASVANDPTNAGATWSIAPATGAGTISTTGLYAAPATISAQQNVTITATSVADTSKSSSSTVNLFPPISVSVTPTASNLYGGQPPPLSRPV